MYVLTVSGAGCDIISNPVTGTNSEIIILKWFIDLVIANHELQSRFMLY